MLGTILDCKFRIYPPFFSNPYIATFFTLLKKMPNMFSNHLKLALGIMILATCAHAYEIHSGRECGVWNITTQFVVNFRCFGGHSPSWCYTITHPKGLPFNLTIPDFKCLDHQRVFDMDVNADNFPVYLVNATTNDKQNTYSPLILNGTLEDLYKGIYTLDAWYVSRFASRQGERFAWLVTLNSAAGISPSVWITLCALLWIMLHSQ